MQVSQTTCNQIFVTVIFFLYHEFFFIATPEVLDLYVAGNFLQDFV